MFSTFRAVRCAALAAAILFPALSALAQQTDVERYDVYAGFAGFETPELNLAQRGFHTQAGVNLKTWLSAGFDYSVATGHNSLTTNLLKPSLQQQLGQEIEYLISIGVIPPTYKLVVPTDAFSQTFAAGPQVEYRHFKAVTLFIRPSLGAIRQKVTPHPTDPVAAAIVAQLVPSGYKVDWSGFYGFVAELTGTQPTTWASASRTISFIGGSSMIYWQTEPGPTATPSG